MTPAQFIKGSARLGLRPPTAFGLLGFHLGSTVFEGLGLGMLLPVFDFIQSDRDAAALAAQSRLWEALVGAYAALGLPVTLAVLLVTALVFFLARQGFIYARMVFTARARFGLIARAREDVFRRYLHTRLSYHENERQGEVINDLTIELDRAVSCLFEVLALVGGAILILGYFGIMFAVSVPMTLAATVVMAVAVFGVRGLILRSRDIGELITQANQNLSAFLVERLKSLRLVRLSGTEAAETAAMGRLSTRQSDRYVRFATLRARVTTVVEPIVVFAGLAFLYAGTSGFGLKLEEIGLFLVIMLRLLPAVKEMLATRQSMMGLEAGLDVLQRRVEALGAAGDAEGGERIMPPLKEGIRYEGVTFAYDRQDGAPALNGVDLVIPAGRMTAFVGPSGAGKSTLIDLLPRIREPQAGHILFDGAPIGEFDVASLRRAIAYAPQSPQVFNVTAAEHIRYGRPEATMEEVVEAARLAGAADFIEGLPDGFDSMVGEEGVRLSGGQRQRLDLARALVRRAPILILDEPTSNLDADAEALFRQALLRIRNETDDTLIIVGHRLSTIMIADQIVVLDGGRVVEAGSHVELLARGGWYAQAVAKQAGPRQLGDIVHG